MSEGEERDNRDLEGMGNNGPAGESSKPHDPRFDATAETFVDNTQIIGTDIGRYHILSVLGEGGGGVVYLAQQNHPIKRRVALKVIKPGMDSKQVIARFEAERQALALLDHPNIAHVFDAGATDLGRPYFVMEFVKGIPITDFCDQGKLALTERLRLFIPLCHAIQHAHQKGIIHRDIKPSNALVMLQDDKPVPKIIDFGVAKALHQPLTDRTMVTLQGQFVGTPEYMSPEQAEISNLDVDTRSDIYSLGVLLYEMLTGCTPFDSKDLRSKGYAEMQRIIREQEPIKPSTRLTTMGGKLTDIARQRSATADQLRKSVRDDLDWIVMKAMEKDRARRYATVSDLAEDLERHLNNEPVLARPPSKVYRFQKMVRRNKGLFAAVAVVAAVLVLGVIVSTWQAVLARRAEQRETRLRQEAQANALAMRQLAYASDMSLAQQALAMNDLGRARRLLDSHRPTSNEVDLRGWEWRYLWQECRSDALGELCRYPNSAAYSVTYSPDGKVLAVAGIIQNFVEIWDVPGRRRIATLQANEGHLVAFSPCGDLLATNAGNQIRLWRTGTWNLIGHLSASGDIAFLKFSPDGTRLACLSSPHELTVWEVEKWSVIQQMSSEISWGAHIAAMDISPDSKTLVVGGTEHRLQVIDIASGKTNFEIIDAHPDRISSVVWSPSGTIIASGSAFTGGPIRLWDAASGKPLGELVGHTSWICELIFSTDGRRLYSASGDQTIRIWDAEQRQCLAILRGNKDEVYGLALSPDRTTLASACKDGIVAFWSAAPPPEEKQPRMISFGKDPMPVIVGDGRVMAVIRDGTVRLIDMATSKEIEELPSLGSDIQDLYYSPDRTLLASGTRSGKIRVWSFSDHCLVRELGDPNNPIYLGNFYRGGTRMLSASSIQGTQRKVVWWDTQTWQPVHTFMQDVESISAGAISPDGRLWAFGTGTGGLHWLNAETGELLKTRAGAHRFPVAGVAFSGDGLLAASVAEDGTLAIWETPSFKKITAFKGHLLGAHGVAFSPDGRRLATGGNSPDAVKLWDLSTRRELMTLSGQGSIFRFVAFSPDERWLVACSTEGTLHLWHAPSWAEIEAVEKQDGSHGPER